MSHFASTARSHDEWQQRQRDAAPGGRDARKASHRAAQAQGKVASKLENEAEARPEGKPYVRRKRKASRLKSFARWVLLPGALAGGAAWALNSPKWAVSGVDVEGVDSTPPALLQPIEAALLGQNWLRADLAAARARLAKVPTVQSASVSREWSRWPPRLLLRIEERRPWLKLGGGPSWWVIDRSGIAFRRADPRDPADRDLYAITATEFEPGSLRAGQKVPPAIWSGVQRLALALEGAAGRGEKWSIRRAYLDRDGMASLRLSGGPHNEMLVRLGDGQWAPKMERARRALAFFEAAGRRASSLNLVSYSMPTWTPLPPPKPASEDAPASAREAPNSDAAVPTTPPDAAPEAAPEAASQAPEDNAGATGTPASEAPGTSSTARGRDSADSQGAGGAT